MNRPRFRIITITLCLALSVMLPATALATGNINATDKYAWAETSGWFNFAPTGAGVTVYADHLEGYAWSESVGWIKLGSHTGGGTLTYGNTSGAADWGVNRSGTSLSGYAWSETAGWINFKPTATGAGVNLNEQSGAMDGWAWGENIGWLHIRNVTPAYGVQFLPTFGVSAIVFDGAKGYAAQDGAGIWRSTDSGATWIAATGQPANQRVKCLVIHPVTKSTLYAATYGGGVYASVNSGVDWTACTNGGLSGASLNAVSLAIDPTGILFAGTEAGIFTSADCAAWTAVNGGLTVDAATPPVSIVIDPTTPAMLYAGLDGAGVWKSVNSGGSWTAANGTAPNDLSNLRIKALARASSGVIYSGTYGGGVFKTTDGGSNWSVCNTATMTNQNVVSLTIDASGRLYAGTEGGVFASSDGCATWKAMNAGLLLSGIGAYPAAPSMK